jgi:cell division protein FtsL
MDKSAFDNLSEETRAKLIAAKTPEEILEIAKSEGIKLSEEELEMVSGGDAWRSCNYS